MIAKGTVVRTVGSFIYEYAVALPEANFYARNGDLELTADDYGKSFFVRYDPQDQFCTIIPDRLVTDLLSGFIGQVSEELKR
ncbi:MAG: hypothetical protein LUQ37_08660 [Methanoregulaceae archaeon]|jgi:hypothetical protein|nr:hypothetical protein [Methanoregulaceae archaeon]